MQYFIGYSSFCNEAPFDASLFVEFRNRLGLDELNRINEKIVKLYTQSMNPVTRTSVEKDDEDKETKTLIEDDPSDKEKQ